MIRLYAIAAAALLAGGVLVWMRYDAAQDALRQAESAAQDARIKHIDDARGVSDDVSQIPDDDLHRELCKRLSSGPC